LAPEILEVAKKEREVALAYFQEIGFFDEPFPKVIVDLGWHATLQAKLHELLSIERNYPKDNVVGLYAGLFAMTLKITFTRGMAQGMCWSPFDSHEWQSRTWPVVQLLEILHMAPHGSVCGYRKSSESSENVPENAGENAGESTAPHYEAVHADNPLECELHQKIVGPMQELALESLLNGLDSGGIIWEELSPNVFLETWKDLAFYPSSTEAAALGQLLHWDGIEHTGEGVPLVPPPPANETEAAELMKKTLIWLPGMLRQWKTENVLKKDVFDKLVWNSDRLTNETKRYLTQ
jgi:hypothetical protein